MRRDNGAIFLYAVLQMRRREGIFYLPHTAVPVSCGCSLFIILVEYYRPTKTEI